MPPIERLFAAVIIFIKLPINSLGPKRFTKISHNNIIIKIEAYPFIFFVEMHVELRIIGFLVLDNNGSLTTIT